MTSHQMKKQIQIKTKQNKTKQKIQNKTKQEKKKKILSCVTKEEESTKWEVMITANTGNKSQTGKNIHIHDHESLNPSRGRGDAALMNTTPAVSISAGHGQGLGPWQSSFLSTQQCCPSISFSACPFFLHLELCTLQDGPR